MREVAKVRQLETFNYHFKWNSVNDKRIPRMRESLSQLKNLKCLSLEVFMTQESLSTFCDIFIFVSGLEELNLKLKCNMQREIDMKLFAKSIRMKSLARLQLTLYENNITAAGASALANELVLLKDIQEFSLDISCNNIGEMGGSAIVDSLYGKRALKSIKLFLRNTKAGTMTFRGLQTFFSEAKSYLDHFYLDMVCDPLTREDLKAMEQLKAKHSTQFICYY